MTRIISLVTVISLTGPRDIITGMVGGFGWCHEVLGKEQRTSDPQDRDYKKGEIRKNISHGQPQASSMYPKEIVPLPGIAGFRRA